MAALLAACQEQNVLISLGVEREVEIYLARVAAERDSQAEPDDSTAAAARAGAPEARPRLLEPVT